MYKYQKQIADTEWVGMLDTVYYTELLISLNKLYPLSLIKENYPVNNFINEDTIELDSVCYPYLIFIDYVAEKAVIEGADAPNKPSTYKIEVFTLLT